MTSIVRMPSRSSLSKHDFEDFVWMDVAIDELAKIHPPRDDFYCYLVTQEIVFWVQHIVKHDIDKILTDVAELIPRRGFNENERTLFRKIAELIINNGDKIRALFAENYCVDSKMQFCSALPVENVEIDREKDSND